RVQQPTYSFAMEKFEVDKGGSSFITDNFTGTVPPAGPTFPNSPPNPYNTSGTFTSGLDADGRHVLFLNGSGSAFVDTRGGNPVFSNSATLAVGTGASAVFTPNDDFTVSGLFDITVPSDIGTSYAIRLADRTNGGSNAQPGTQAVELAVIRDAVTGQADVQLREINFATATSTILDAFAINAPPADHEIQLQLSYNHSQPGVVTASYVLEANNAPDNTTSFTFSSHGLIFQNGETWTIPQFQASSTVSTTSASPTADAVKQGIYGILDITQSGTWTYALNNSLSATQALAAGDMATDSFAINLTDSHGASTSQVINVTVHGTNDAPVVA